MTPWHDSAVAIGGRGVSTVQKQGQLAGPLSVAVADLCRRLQSQVGPRTAAGFGEVLRRLGAPLQVAVAGRISSGKSTLVNALIGRRVAPTGVGECTRLVTRFQYGTVDRVEVVMKDGTRNAVPLAAGGMIPAALGLNLNTVSHLEAYLTNAALRGMTVIDTPGLGSLDAASARRTEGLLGTADDDGATLDDTSRSAVAGAEAVLYVVTQSVRADDQQTLAAFTAATASREAGPVNAIAVLNKADLVVPDSVRGADDDVWKAASIVAARQAELLTPRVVDVLPVIGLLAETAETGAFTSSDADALHRLSEVDDDALDTMTMSADLFTTWECAVPTGARVRLLERLDLHGIRRAVDAIRAEPAITAGELRRTIVECSGLTAVRERLYSVFAARADGIKAAAALASIAALARAADDPTERGRVHDAIEVLLSKPEAHHLRLLEALTLVASGAVELPYDLTEEVIRVGSNADLGSQLGMAGASRTELAEHALERAGWWRSFASFGATPAQGRVAHVVHRAYFLIWQQLGGHGRTAARGGGAQV